MIRILISVIFCLPFIVRSQFYTGDNVEFGKNRVQFEGSFKWFYKDFTPYPIYFYSGADSLATFCSTILSEELKSLESQLNFKSEAKPTVIIFKSLQDFRQSNIGNYSLGNPIGAQSQLISEKLILYYTGERISFEKQIREVCAQMLIQEIILSQNWSDASIETFPPWFVQGFAKYLTNEWCSEFEIFLKNEIKNNNSNEFLRQENLVNQANAGFIFFKYLETRYSKNELINALYLTEYSGDIYKTIKTMFQFPAEYFMKDMFAFYKSKFSEDEIPLLPKEDFKLKAGQQLLEYKTNKEENLYAYSVFDHGKVKVYLKENDLSNKKKGEKINQIGHKIFRIQDLTYPIISWHPLTSALAMIYESKGSLFLDIYTVEDKEKTHIELKNIQAVNSFEYAPDGKTMIFSGVNNGQTDLYLYRIAGNSVQKLTDDAYDDVFPSFTKDGAAILFSSTRNSDTMPRKKSEIITNSQYDLFKYPLQNADKNIVLLEKLSDSPQNELKIKERIKNEYYFLSDQSGTYQLHNLLKDSTIIAVDTIVHYTSIYKQNVKSNFDQNVLDFAIENENYIITFGTPTYKCISDQKLDQVFEFQESSINYYFEEKYRNQNIEIETQKSTDSTSYSVIKTSADGKFIKETIYLFENETYGNDTTRFEEKLTKKLEEKRILKQIYSLNFTKEKSKLGVDNNYANLSYQKYPGQGSEYFASGPSFFYTASIADLMEDYRLVGGIRTPLSKPSLEFFLELQLHKKRIDHNLLFYRRSYTDRDQQNAIFKLITYEIRDQISFPINEICAWKNTFGYRYDRTNFLTENTPSLVREPINEHQSSFKSEFIIDNSYSQKINTWQGWKSKFFVEDFYTFSGAKGNMVNIGFDTRYGKKISRNIYWINRISASTSLGTKRLLYYLGATDDWFLRPKVSFDKTITVDPSQNFAYQTIATPMRGFIQNARNGNSFAVFNSELRLNLASILFKKTLSSDFFRSLQLLVFADVGSAWTGSNPYSADNFFNTQTIVDKPVTIKIFNAREPIIAGFGSGLRAKVFGYLLKFDAAWGLQNGILTDKPVYYFGIGFDI